MTDRPEPLLLGELDNARRVVAGSRSAITTKLGMLGDRVQETVADVKQAFSVDHQMQQRPWLMVGGITGTLWAMAKQAFLSPDTRASQPEPAFNPHMTNAGDREEPHGHSTW